MPWPFKDKKSSVKTPRELLNVTIDQIRVKHKEQWMQRYQPPCEYCELAYVYETGQSIVGGEVAIQHAILHELRKFNNRL
jgi:hypothetical protein